VRPVPLDSVAAFVAKRPLHSALATAKFCDWSTLRPRNWRDAIRDHVSQNIGGKIFSEVEKRVIKAT